MTNTTEKLHRDNKGEEKVDMTKDNNNSDNTDDRTSTTSTEKDTDTKKNTVANDHDSSTSISDLAEHYKDLQHYSNNDNDHHPIPSLPAVPHHAPPEDSSELLSPWWSEEPPDVTDPEAESNNGNSSNHTNSSRNDSSNSNNKLDDHLSSYIVKFSRQATNNKGEEQWKEDCYLWTKEPNHQKESNLVDDLKEAGRKANLANTAATATASSSLPESNSQSDTIKKSSSSPQQQQQHSPSLSPPSPTTTSDQTYPLNSQCAMVCLFRESQQRKTKKRQELNLASSWNPFYGNWLVVSHTRSGFLEHIKETDIIKKTSPEYYTVELGERFGRTGEDVAKFMTRTFTPVQELGRRYIESWKDGTQTGFFTRFIDSAKRGDAFFLLRDSARRIMENMVANDDKKKDDDDHKR
ncbi:hypothetical protein BCR42DRAFT_409026 [Absidia repens]|uniref:Uncharacterized protein n=1 Tax=Absidia repens TaxID=90262 RepID=A0A1X2IQI9_9FUNG|nr:hypothetical protein BCR42DRAFT_409026 [Absidia repens]